ncbi:MAG TPA: tetratricopeptide repeat protein, partial [Alphaproteobacteria bacterium]|nr:tetratricopeptide repeat protein [Alphaproteobacteria bacterium]
MPAPNHAFALMQKAVDFHRQGNMPEAEQSYRAVLAADPRHVDALRLLGGLYMQSNEPGRAADCFEQALALAPDHPELLNNLGVALYGQGRREEALARYRQAVRLAPEFGDAIDNLGTTLLACGKPDEAIAWLQRSLQLRPGNAQTYIRLGHACRTQGQKAEAIEHYRRALNLAPENAEALTHLGNLLREAGQSEEACAAYRRLVALQPQNANIRLNLGTIFHDMGKTAEAMEHYDEVLRLEPHATGAIVSRAGLLMESDRPEEAHKGYEQALRLNPGLADAEWGKALALLALGDYAEGWKLYEARFARRPIRDPVLLATPRWRGEDLRGKRLLIWGEQGLGDMLQFVRYAGLCINRGAAVIVQCQPALRRLLRNCPFIDEIVATPAEGRCDYQIPAMSLPLAFGTTLETIPKDTPYLFVDQDTRRKWTPRFAGAEGFKVGLVWAGNPRKNQIEAHITDRQRSMALEAMKPLLDVPGCRFYNLQKGAAADEIAVDGLGARLIDYMPEAGDFLDTAAIIEHLDLVISVDTSVVHVAGGLGKPVWVLSRFGGCWRWLRNREASPWYPAVRVFGQTALGDWEHCIEKVCLTLRERLLVS